MARQVTGEGVEGVDGEGLAIEDVSMDDDDKDDNEEANNEGFEIVVVEVDKRAGEAAQAHVR